MTLVSLFLAPLTFLQAAGKSKPNIVVIYTDDQGYGDMSALNPKSKIQTPNLDRLANQGIIFTDGHCTDTVCTPLRYSLLTGRYSWRTSLKSGVLLSDGECLIAKNRMTVASLLKANGYQTAMFGKWRLQMKFPGTIGHRDWSHPITDGPTEHGFDYFFGIPARFMPPYDAEPQSKSDIEIAPSFRDDICIMTCTDTAVNYIASHAESAKKGKPLFIYFALS